MIELLEWGKMKRGRPNLGEKAHKNRFVEMAQMYRDGKTLREIGAAHGISGERVRTILRSGGMEAASSGRALAVYLRRKDKKQLALIAREARCFAKNGCSLEVWKKMGAKARAAFNCQKQAAKNIGAEWNLTLGEWWRLWEGSGKWEERGRGSGYCLSRIGNCGPFSADNVEVVLSKENARNARGKHGRCKNGDKGGVYFMYPNLSNPWLAKAGRKHIGLFATEAAARAAREAFIAARK